jgi:AraC family transcriptional regulator, regulatory protein of adaptative response / methylated-DNA-[protein]-cysteine methyltransferase
MNPNKKLYLTNEERWQAVANRDKQADGIFIFGVLTTGIYCRPGCSSKLPNRKNVRFYDTCEQAEEAGLRPCKRCKPKSASDRELHIDMVVKACQMMDESEVPPPLAELADKFGFSTSHFQRIFNNIVGVTPKQYAMQNRLNRVRIGLQGESTSVTEVVYDAGFNSSSRFYENVNAKIGMHPSNYRKGGHGSQIRFATAPCYLGWALVAATQRGICAISFADTPIELERSLRTRFPEAVLITDDPGVSDWLSAVLAYLDVPRGALDLPLDIQGTAFQRRVWMALQEIPAGSTASYSEVSSRLGKPNAARAVAGACASNTLAVAIPCHRIVRSDGSPGGYRWGLERKRRLLAREAHKQ